MLPSEEIKEKTNIVDLIGEYIQLKKAGVNYRALCPFHQEKSPSFMVSPTKQIWHCFGCGLGGDIFEFVKHMEGVEFPEALQILASRVGIMLERPTVSYQKEVDQKKVLLAINDLAAKFYAKVLQESQVAELARQYLVKRGLKSETVKTWGLGFAPDDFHTFENFIVKKGFQRQEALLAGLLAEKNGQYFDRFRGRIMFPLHDIHGRVVGFTARILIESPSSASGGSGNTLAKYVNSPETLIYSKSSLVYGLHLAKNAIRQKNLVIVVEGNMDAISAHEAGFSNIVASSGTALTANQLETLKRFTNNIVFAFDVDEAGFLATRRAVELALSLGFNVSILSIPKALAKDPDELIRRNRGLWEEQMAGAKSFLDFYFEAIFAKMNKPLTNLDKKQAVADLLPLVSLLPETIDRVHYSQKLAAEIGVDGKIILELLNQYLNKNKIRESAKQVSFVKSRLSRQEILERRVMGLLLKFFHELKEDWESLQASDISSPVFREIFGSVSSLVRSNQFELKPFLFNNPKLAPEIELLIFAVENELSMLTDWKIEDVRKSFLGEFRQESLKHKMKELSSQIKQAEQIGRLSEAKTLSTQFNSLSQELSKYHSSI